MKVKISKRDLDRLLVVERELSEVRDTIQKLQSQLMTLQQRLWYVQGKRDQVLIELAEKYSFDPTKRIEIDEKSRVLRVIGGETDG